MTRPEAERRVPWWADDRRYRRRLMLGCVLGAFLGYATHLWIQYDVDGILPSYTNPLALP